LACSIRIMRAENCGIVPVIEGNGESRVVGVVTDRDIALHLGDKDARPSEVCVRDVMTTDVVRVAPEDDESVVTRKMEQAQVRRVLVCEGDSLRGVIATADLARESARSGKARTERDVGRVMEKVSQP